jgi:small subunit ribosomal protein S2
MTEAVAEQPLLIDEDTFLNCGVHIGTKQKSKDMQPYIHRVRDDGLRILDVSCTSRQIRVAAEFLNGFEPAEILVVSARQYGWKPARQFAEASGVTCIPGRFTPGRLTNPEMQNFIEPRAILLTDPAADAQPFREALNIAIPVVAMCDANNLTTGVDLVIPGNNKGRRALALIYWLLAREMLRLRGDLAADEDLEATVDDFEAPLV